MTRYARPALVVVFVAMLATPALIRRAGDRAASSAAAADASDARYVRPSELASLGVTEAVARVVMKGVALRQVLNEDE